jgi:hypothetical protein
MAADVVTNWRLRDLLLFCRRAERPQALSLLDEHPSLLNEGWDSEQFGLTPHGNHVISRGDTALIAAAMGMDADEKCDAELVKALLKRGADTSKVNVLGVDALICASCMGHISVVEILLAHGASVTVQPRSKRGPPPRRSVSSALHWAARKNYPQICLLLLKNGADLLATHDGGLNALQEYGNAMRWPSWDETNKVNANKALLLPAFRAGPHPSQVKRRQDEAWKPRWALMCVIVGCGFRPLAAKLKELKAEALDRHGTSAQLPGIDIDTPEKRAAFILGQVFSNEGLLRLIVSFL